MSMKSRSLSEDKLLFYGGISEFHSFPVRKNYVGFGRAGLGRNQDIENPIKHQNKLGTCADYYESEMNKLLGHNVVKNGTGYGTKFTEIL
jgi:hypothetical protein